IDFTGVFVPTDVSWRRQLAALGATRLSRDNQKLLGISAFTTHILKALVIAMTYRAHAPDRSGLVPHRRVAIDVKTEASLVQTIATAWKLQVGVSSFMSLKQALSQRLVEIKALAGQLTKFTEADADRRLADIEFVHFNFLECCTVGVEAFDDATSST